MPPRAAGDGARKGRPRWTARKAQGRRRARRTRMRVAADLVASAASAAHVLTADRPLLAEVDVLVHRVQHRRRDEPHLRLREQVAVPGVNAGGRASAARDQQQKEERGRREPTGSSRHGRSISRSGLDRRGGRETDMELGYGQSGGAGRPGSPRIPSGRPVLTGEHTRGIPRGSGESSSLDGPARPGGRRIANSLTCMAAAPRMPPPADASTHRRNPA